MQIVAKHLQDEAVKIDDYVEAELYARSSFNRYYYAVFLCVRSTLVEFDEKYKNSLNHADIHGLLKSTIRKEIKKIQKKAEKLSDYDLVMLCQKANSRNLEFAETYKKAYAIRVVSDYNPDSKISFSHSEKFTLSGVSATEAHAWLDKAELWSSLILETLRQGNA